MQKHKITTFSFTNNKKEQYKLHNIDEVKKHKKKTRIKNYTNI